MYTRFKGNVTLKFNVLFFYCQLQTLNDWILFFLLFISEFIIGFAIVSRIDVFINCFKTQFGSPKIYSSFAFLHFVIQEKENVMIVVAKLVLFLCNSWWIISFNL